MASDERDTFYIASLGSTGWPYVQHRGGPKGFLKVIDDHTVAFADFRGNKKYISTLTDGRVAHFGGLRQAVASGNSGSRRDFRGRKSKKVAREGLRFGLQGNIERVYVIRVEAFDWNCPQHIIPRFTEEEIRDVLAPVEEHVRELEKGNERLKNEVARRTEAKR